MRYEKEIDSSHPIRIDASYAYEADQLAMELVGERQSKREFVNLVRWLIMDKSETVNKDLMSKK